MVLMLKTRTSREQAEQYDQHSCINLKSVRLYEHHVRIPCHVEIMYCLVHPCMSFISGLKQVLPLSTFYLYISVVPNYSIQTTV